MNDITEFGDRLTTLQTGARGLREQLKVEVRLPDEVKAGGVDAAELDFIASDETLDRYDEVVKLDGWELDEYRANPVVLDSHNYGSVAFVLGKSTELLIGSGKMRNRVKFAMDNPLGAMAYKMAKGGFIHSESVGFIPKAWTPGKTKDEPARTFTKQTLLEISLVAVPANPGATIGLALKSGALVKSDVKDLFEFLKTLCNEKAEPPVNPGAKAGGLDVARLTLLADAASAVLRRA